MKNLRAYNVVYNQPVLQWDEALPLGNGKLGCLIYGDGPIHFTLDRVDLWDSRPHPATQEQGFTYQNLLRLVKSGREEDWAEYERLFDKICSDYSHPTKITAGRIELDFGQKLPKLRSEVDLRTATATVQDADGLLKIEAFLSATRYVGVARVKGAYSLDLHIPQYISDTDKKTGLGYPQAEIVKDGQWTYYVQKTFTDFCYGILVYQKPLLGRNELYFTIMIGECVHGMLECSKKELLDAAKLGYNALKGEHTKWWEEYWKKSSISLPDSLLEKTYYRSWYLFASCSRKGFYPMPLQGVWTADNGKLPPWKGDYHHDTNTQLSYQSFLKANRLDEGRVFVDYLWSMRDVFRRFAKEFFGVDGILLPSCSTLDGKPIGGWAHYAFSPTMSIWAAQSFDEYYLYTGDVAFLEEYAYPYFKEIGQAIYGLLEEKEGKLCLPLSSSPEIFDATREAYLQPNSNFDLALLRYLYQTLLRYTETLQKDGTMYASILKKLDEIAVDAEGVVLLDKAQRLPESHRHFSHVMGLYPLHLINYDTDGNKRIYENTLLHLEQLGTGWWVGFSFAMSAQLYAMARNGNAAYEKLRIFAKGFVADNGFHLNGDFQNYGFSQWHYRPFTLESLFGYCDALQEMLLQEHQGYLDIFPAVPKEWLQKVSFKKLRSYGGVLVSAKALKGQVEWVELILPCDMELKIKNVFGAQALHCMQNKGTKALTDRNGYFVVQGKKGKIVLKRIKA